MTSRLPIFFIALSLSATSHADVSEYSSYDECILESLKGVSSDVAASAIIESCRNTFPESTPAAREAAEPAPVPVPVPQSTPAEPPKPDAKPAIGAAGVSRALTSEELGKLKSTLFGGFTTSYKVTFENLNDHITITEVTIAVWDDFDPRGLKKYTQTMNIPPSGEEQVAYEVVYMGDDQGWRWRIDSAKGVPVIN